MKEQITCGWVVMLILAVASPVKAQDAVAPPENIVAAGVPSIPAALAEAAGRYKENREALRLPGIPSVVSCSFPPASGIPTRLILSKCLAGPGSNSHFSQNPSTVGPSTPRMVTTSSFKRMLAGVNGTNFFATI